VPNAPKRPPGRPRSERRKPEGHHHMPKNLRPRLEAAAARLHEVGSPDLAEAVETILSPTGWGHLRRSDPTVSGGEANLDRSMAIAMPIQWRDEIKSKAADAGRKIADDINEGFEQYLSGKFAPEPPARRKAGVGGATTSLNSRPSEALRKQVEEAGAKPSQLAGQYLLQKYQVGPFAPATK